MADIIFASRKLNKRERVKQLSQLAHSAKETLSSEFGLPAQERQFVNALSSGVQYDHLHGVVLGACFDRKTNEIRFYASFGARPQDADAIVAEVPAYAGIHLTAKWRARALRLGVPMESARVYSPNFRTLSRACQWLKKWGRKYCPSLNRKLASE